MATNGKTAAWQRCLLWFLLREMHAQQNVISVRPSLLGVGKDSLDFEEKCRQRLFRYLESNPQKTSK
jgi:hypothetical protein